MAFTPEERQFWLRVYTNGHGEPQCGFPRYSEEKGWYRCETMGAKNLEIHHLLPSAWIIEQLAWADPNSIDLETGMVGVALCKHLHHDTTIHPDIGMAYKLYRQGDKDAFRKSLGQHKKLAEQGEHFWRDDFDNTLREIATQALMDYTREHPNDKYPADKSWRKKKHPKKPQWYDIFWNGGDDE